MKHLDILGKLFDSTIRVKILKFFLLNNHEGFSVEDIAKRLRVKPKLVRDELASLVSSGFIKPKKVVKIIEGKYKTIKKKYNGYIANKDFSLADPLRNLLVDSGGMHIQDLPARFEGMGPIKLFVVSGIFLREPNQSMDLMIVGNKLNKKAIDTEIYKLESEIGKELRYAVFEMSEFMYRLNMYDKLVRDMLEYAHVKLISKIDHPELRA